MNGQPGNAADRQGRQLIATLAQTRKHRFNNYYAYTGSDVSLEWKLLPFRVNCTSEIRMKATEGQNDGNFF